jgi:ABC-type cobalamin/Fe3+-siderophores transport system ATPase subunit
VVVLSIDYALRYSHRCVLLRGGQLVADDVPSVALGAGNLAAVFGVELVPNGAPAFRVARGQP